MNTISNKIDLVFDDNWVETSFDSATEMGIKGFTKEDFAAVKYSLEGRVKHDREHKQNINKQNLVH